MYQFTAKLPLTNELATDLSITQELLRKEIERLTKDIITPTYPTREVCKILNCSHQLISLWIKQGEFPHAYKLNPTRRNSPYRIPHADVEAFLEKRQAQIAQSLPLR